MGLRTGLWSSKGRSARRSKVDNFALMQVELINGRPSDPRRPAMTGFDDLTPTHPHQRLVLETTGGRAVDAHRGPGHAYRQGPARADRIAAASRQDGASPEDRPLAIKQNQPDRYLIVLLIDERPEEVTEMVRVRSRARTPKWWPAHSTNRRASTSTSRKFCWKKLLRMIEDRRDVVILLDSITRLARAHNTEAPSGGKLLSGGLDTNAMQKPKRFFGSQRNVEEGGSLDDPGDIPDRNRQPHG